MLEHHILLLCSRNRLVNNNVQTRWSDSEKISDYPYEYIINDNIKTHVSFQDNIKRMNQGEESWVRMNSLFAPSWILNLCVDQSIENKWFDKICEQF